MRYGRIEPTKENPEPVPPTSGLWRREADGGLVPQDDATARTAGLLLDESTDAESKE